MATSKPPRVRRKSSTGIEQVKHRRTRSGCFTCRMRRVKCDETRPICDRCQKGGRECSFPELPASKASSTSGSAKSRKDRQVSSNSTTTSIKEDSSSNGELELEEDVVSIDYNPIDPQLLNPSFPKVYGGYQRVSKSTSPSLNPGAHRRNSRVGQGYSLEDIANAHLSELQFGSFAKYHSCPTTPEGSIVHSHIRPTFGLSPQWAHLPHDVSFFLDYHQQRINCHHYLLKSDTSSFFKSTLPAYAVQNEALLYAMVAFSSFHYHVNHKSVQYDSFLEYYNRAVALLRLSLDGNRETDVSTLLTILQIASFEEYLGDWANLTQHRKGAHMILTSLYTPETIVESEDNLMIFQWFTRFDLFVATMSCQETVLGRDWYDYHRHFSRAQLVTQPENPNAIIQDAESQARYLGMEVASLLSRRSKGTLSPSEFDAEAAIVERFLDLFWAQIQTRLSKATVHHPLGLSLEPQPLYDHANDFVYTDDFWALNYVFADVHALSLMLKCQTSVLRGIDQSAFGSHSAAVCGVFTAMESFAEAPEGAILPLQAPLGMVAVWTSNPQMKRWFCSKFAKLEDQLGFVYPLSYRTQLANLWGEPELRFSWRMAQPQQVPVSASLEAEYLASLQHMADLRDSHPVDTPPSEHSFIASETH